MPALRLEKAIPYYATLQELATFLKDWTETYKLSCIFAKQSPKYKAYQEANWQKLQGIVVLLKQYELVLLELEPFQPVARHMDDFLVFKNSHYLGNHVYLSNM